MVVCNIAIQQINLFLHVDYMHDIDMQVAGVCGVCYTIHKS